MNGLVLRIADPRQVTGKARDADNPPLSAIELSETPSGCISFIRLRPDGHNLPHRTSRETRAP
jgi:hypothetical protein